MWKWERVRRRCYAQKGIDRQIDGNLMNNERMPVDLVQVDRNEQRQQRNNMKNRGRKM